MQLEGKVAVITGGASGMGQSTALRFLNEGAKVVVADYNEQSGQGTLDLATRAGHQANVRFIRTDVAQEADVEAMIDCTCSAFGRLDIVFNNAGVGGAVGPVWEIDVADWDYTFDVLVKGVFLGIKHGARAMKQQGEGEAIINTASIAGLSGRAGPLVTTLARARHGRPHRRSSLVSRRKRCRVCYRRSIRGGRWSHGCRPGNLEAFRPRIRGDLPPRGGQPRQYWRAGDAPRRDSFVRLGLRERI